jgi:ribose-phosphate pyrophosphokinase
MRDFSIFAGSANRDLALWIARTLGVQLGACTVEHFPDGETYVRLDDSVRKQDVFLVQPLSPPVNENLFELLAFADAARRASARSITAIVPYMGYSRSDKRHGHREPISARVVATLMEAVGIDHIVTLDLHSPQIEGFFHIPVDSLSAVTILCDVMETTLSPNTVVVSPDSGRVKMAVEYARHLRTEVAILHKQRESGSETEVIQLVGDVQGRPCLIVDDMISTGGTIARSVDALLAAGAKAEIYVAATHGIFVEGAREKLSHVAIQEVFVTDTVQIVEKNWTPFRIIPIGPLIASSIHRLLTDQPLYDESTRAFTHSVTGFLHSTFK